MINLRSEQLRISILKKGAEICSVKNNDDVEFIWQADPTVWARHSPVLFPIVGKIKDDFYKIQDKEYSLSQHGFARDKEFKINNLSETSCTLELVSDQETKKIFPFDFILNITHEIKGRTLSTTYEITNPSPEKLYFSIGAHPGFSCHLADHETLSDYVIEFETTQLLQTVLHNGLRSNEKKKLKLKRGTLQLTQDTFENDALVFENSQINSVKLKSLKSDRYIIMHCNDWPYFGIWSKKGCSDFVCLEPWYGITDYFEANGDFQSRDGLLNLSPGQSFNCAFSVTFN